MQKEKEKPKENQQPDLGMKVKQTPLAKACQELIELKDTRNELANSITQQKEIIMKLMMEQKMMTLSTGGYLFQIEDVGAQLVVKKEQTEE